MAQKRDRVGKGSGPMDKVKLWLDVTAKEEHVKGDQRLQFKQNNEWLLL